MDRLISLDMARMSVRELNQFLHHELPKNAAGAPIPGPPPPARDDEGTHKTWR